MICLAEVFYVVVAAAAAGAPVTAVLSLHLMGWQIAGAFLAGCVVAVPTAHLLARKIYAKPAPHAV